MLPSSTKIFEGLVVDVITNETHPKYSEDGLNFGMVTVRFMRDQSHVPTELIHIAHPLDYNNISLPLIGEVVLVFKVFDKLHYTQIASLTKGINHSSLIGHNEHLENLTTAPPTDPTKTRSASEEFQFVKSKEKFVKNDKLRPLRHFAGDHIIQGRFGNSIRFGSSLIEKDNVKLNPNILFRVGQNPDAELTRNTEYGLLLEDINKDAASIWMVSDQTVPFEPATKDGKNFLRSSGKTPFRPSGSQIIANADQLILNSKKRSIYLFSAVDINLNSLLNTNINVDNMINMTAEVDINSRAARSQYMRAHKNITLAAAQNITIQGENRVQLIGNRIFIGSNGSASESAAEPMVLGIVLANFCNDLIKALVKPPLGIVGLLPVNPHPAFILRLIKLIATYKLLLPNPLAPNPAIGSGATFNSKDNFVLKSNKFATLFNI